MGQNSLSGRFLPNPRWIKRRTGRPIEIHKPGKLPGMAAIRLKPGNQICRFFGRSLSGEIFGHDFTQTLLFLFHILSYFHI